LSGRYPPCCVETAARWGLPQPKKPDPWASAIAALLREVKLDGWKEMLAAVEASPFLRGEIDKGNGQSPFRASLDWLLKPKNFAKVQSGQYAGGGRPTPRTTRACARKLTPPPASRFP